MGRVCPIVILLLLAVSSHCLHFERVGMRHTTAQSELQALKAQQSSFENQVNTLISNISTIDAKVKATNKTAEKVLLLQNAIISQRETVFALSNSILPPFNLSKNACQELTNEQKINLLDEVGKAKEQVEKIKKLASTIPPCEEITLINSDIAKQTVLLDSIEKAIYTKCDSSIILSATIFQSNIYASNWILGGQTIDDLIEEYYQRSVQYDNITNCPLEFPFFDGKQCISCDVEDSVFNMMTKKCEYCPTDTAINVALRVCQQIPHYSDYSKTNNYNLDGAGGLPNPDPKLTPCPPSTPFWNGTCVNCKGGKWWSVKDSKCKSCPAGQAFDSNLKKCITPSGETFLTVLEGTQWVTAPGNQTKVLQERTKLLETNSSPKYCSVESPYFDGIQCVSCDQQFDLKTLKCVSAPENTAYDDNLHAYISVDQNKETNVKAPNILASGFLVNSTVPDCSLSAPYFDGINCIQCPEPFVLFDIDKKKCVACGSTDVFNNTSHKCERRPSLFISANFNNLMATPRKSIEDYKKELYDKVQNNKDYIVDKCNDDKQYSNYTACFSCRQGEYFNVESKACSICNGTMNQTTSTCVPKGTVVTNLTNATNLLLTDKKTLKEYSDDQKLILGPVESCPKDKPYAVAGTSCIACPDTAKYFNLKDQKCVACQPNSFYNTKLLICEEGVLVSNVSALKKYVEVENYTLPNLKKQIQEIKKTKPIIECPAATPFYDGKKCNACSATTYVNLKTFQCISPVLVANVEVLYQLDNIFEQGNYTIDSLAASIANITLPKAVCPETTPAYNGKECYSCPEDKYYKLKTNECVEGVTVTNTEALKKLKNVKQTDNYTIANIQKQISAISRPTFPCIDSKPLFDGKKCISCDSYALYDLKANNCIPPKLYTNTTALKGLKYIELGNNTISNIDAANAKIPVPKKPCAKDAPLWNGTACLSCPNGTYYNLQTLACTSPISITNVDAIKKSNNFLETDNYTLTGISQQDAKNILPTVACNASTPLFDGKSCIACSNSIYDLKSLSCVNCSKSDYYNTTTNKCAPKPNYYPNLNNNNWIVSSESGIDKVINFTKTRKNLNDSLQCPQGKEFFNNLTFDCQTCSNGTYFNYETFVCAPCAAKQEVDPNTHKCAVKLDNSTYQTSLNSENLIYNGISIGELQENYNNNQKKFPKIQDCPQEKPYFDGYECISCNQHIPYFNLDTRLCQNCDANSAKYDKELHDCVTQNEVVTTSAKLSGMYSSIF